MILQQTSSLKETAAIFEDFLSIEEKVVLLGEHLDEDPISEINLTPRECIQVGVALGAITIFESMRETIPASSGEMKRTIEAIFNNSGLELDG